MSVQRRGAMGIVVRVIPSLLLLVAPATSLCAEAMCSCIAPPGEFLVPTGAEIPADSRGIPFWSAWAVHWDESGPRLSEERLGGFTIDRLEGARRIRLRAEATLLDSPLISDGDRHETSRLVLVSPVEGFVAGERYLFSHHPIVDYGENRGPAQVVVLVSRLRLVDLVASEPARLSLGEAKREPLRVEARGGLCSTEIDAATVPIAMELPSALTRWQDVLLFTVTVDGDRIWRPKPSICSRVPPGHSWQGRSRELLFTDCRVITEENKWDMTRDSLEPGFHRLEMSAWWPGVEARVTASTVVQLSCGPADTP